MKKKARLRQKSRLLPSSRPLLLPKSESPEKLAKAKPPAPPGTCCWFRGGSRDGIRAGTGLHGPWAPPAAAPAGWRSSEQPQGFG